MFEVSCYHHILCVILKLCLNITFAVVLNPSLPAWVHCTVVKVSKGTILFKKILPAQYQYLNLHRLCEGLK